MLFELQVNTSTGAYSALRRKIDPTALAVENFRYAGTLTSGQLETVSGLPAYTPTKALIVVIGQSQAVGLDTGTSPYGPRTGGLLEVAQGKNGPPEHTLINYEAPGENDTEGTGISETLGISLARVLRPAITPVIYNLAVSSTGFISNDWGVGDHLYTSVLSKVSGVLGVHPDMHLGAYAWHQGRRDRDQPSEWYKSKLLAMINGFWSNAGTAPFIMGTQFFPFLTQYENQSYRDIDAVIRDIPSDTPGVHTAILDEFVYEEPTAPGHWGTPSLLGIGVVYANTLLETYSALDLQNFSVWKTEGDVKTLLRTRMA